MKTKGRPLTPFDMPMEREPGALYHDQPDTGRKLWKEKLELERQEREAGK